MDWLKKNYDISLLALATVILLGSAGLVFFQSPLQPKSSAVATPVASNGKETIPAPDFDAITKAQYVIASPKLWNEKSADGRERGALFVSRPYLLKDGKLIDPIEGQEQLHAPITNAWLIKYSLNYAEINIKEQDPDNDGFTNLEEFEAQTDPSDPASAPPAIYKLKLVKYEAKPFRLVFQGDPSGEGVDFQINAKELKGAAKTQYKRIGETIENAPYKILKYEKKEAINERTKAMDDVSELVVQNTETEATIILVRNKETNDPTSFGEFLNLLNNETFRLKKGEEFTVKPDVDTPLKLIDISNDSAQIEIVNSGKTYTVTKTDSKINSPSPIK
jgi:hypothetical protein